MIESSLYDSLTLEIQTFLPHVTAAQLEQCDLDEMCEWAARARVVQTYLEHIVTNGVVRAFKQKE